MGINTKDVFHTAEASKPEMYEDAPEVFIVFFDPVIQPFYLGLGQEPQDVFLKLSGAFAWDDFNQDHFFCHCFRDNPVQF